ncbi:MAG: H-NS family nucleoid-associated regulatory protein [Succinivibrionaceae bacterium]
MTFIETISNIRFLRVACRELSYAELENAYQKFTEIMAERRLEEEEKNKKTKERNEAIDAIRTLVEQTGINPNDLAKLLNQNSLENLPKQRNVPPKFKFTDENGTEHTWTGQGRTPTIFTQCMIRENKPKEFYLIKDKTNQI